ncbi:MAG TPA: phage major capsid protein [Paludibacteraceae bacterium]|nr:phage major capsid protein [Paludibacteraceae bacterium]
MSFISRTDADALIPVEVSQDIVRGVAEQSVAMQLFTRLPNMSSKVQKMAVVSALPVAYWVNGDNGVKQYSEQVWASKYLTAEEIAVIIPIPESVLDDAEYDIWGEVKPRLVEAFGAVFDSAVLFGTNKPASYPDDIKTAAIDKGYSFGKGTASFLSNGLNAISLVEGAGYIPDAIIGGADLNALFRTIADTNGDPISGTDLQALKKVRVVNGSFSDTVQFIVGDFKSAVFALRQDITYKLLTEGVIQDPSNSAILYNLAQQDMVALRAVMRIAYQLPNPVNRLQSSEDARLPFAVCLQTAHKVVLSASPDGSSGWTGESLKITLSADVANVKIYYTDDGTTPPTTASTLYDPAKGITITATKTIKALGVSNGCTNSDVLSKTFTKSS